MSGANQKVIDAESRLAMQDAEKVHRKAAGIMQEMAAKGAFNSGATVRRLVDALKAQAEETADRLVSAHLLGGESDPEKIASGVRQVLEPFLGKYMSSYAARSTGAWVRGFEHLRPEMGVLLDSLKDRAIVAVGRAKRSASDHANEAAVGLERVRETRDPPMPTLPTIVLLTVNSNETHAVLDAFLGEGNNPQQQTIGDRFHVEAME